MTSLLDADRVDEGLRHWRELFGYAVTLTRDAARAEDLCQEAIVRVAERDRRLERDRSLRPLLLRVVRNLAIDEARRRTPDALEEIDEADAIAPESTRQPDPPLEAAVRRETIERVRHALDRLPPIWRSMLFLRDGLGFSYGDIGEIEGRTTDVVRVTLHRARRRIRTLLHETCPSENET